MGFVQEHSGLTRAEVPSFRPEGHGEPHADRRPSTAPSERSQHAAGKWPGRAELQGSVRIVHFSPRTDELGEWAPQVKGLKVRPPPATRPRRAIALKVDFTAPYQ